jgi:hypothetical protein
LGTETDQPNGLETQECSVAETPRLRRTPAKRRLLAQSQENLCGAGVIGGAMRTRTKNPDGFIDGARRDRRAIVARPCGNGGLSTPTPPISSAAAPGKTATSRASNRVFATNSSTARHSTRYAKRKPSSRVGGVTTTVSGRTRPRCSCPGSPRGRLRYVERLRRPRWRPSQPKTNIPAGPINGGRLSRAVATWWRHKNVKR